MKKTFLAGLALGVAAPIALLAQETAPAAGAKAPKIAIIDMARVSNESLMGKGYAAQLEALQNEINSEGTKKQSELQKLDAAIKAIQDELEKQGSVLSAEAADKKRQEIVKKGRERQAFLEDGQQEIQRLRERAQQQAQGLNNEFQLKIKPHIEAVAKEKGLDIILDSQVALTVNRDFDISRDVIIKADEAEKTAKATTGGGAKPPSVPAPAKPSPAAPPKP
jgi:Skp family chaperone for outer membrane proteins